MSDPRTLTTPNQADLEALRDIRQLMQRSSRFISLSGLSGVAAGLFALGGAYFAYDWIYEYYVNYNNNGYRGPAFQHLKWNLFFLALVVMGAALISAFYFTWRKAKRQKMPIWDHTARRLSINMMIPLASGGLFILAMLQRDQWQFVSPACLIFYGLALVNASKYTLTEIRYLGYIEILLGLINTQFIGYGLHFWALGFGVMHIIYGVIMWWNHDRKASIDAAL